MACLPREVESGNYQDDFIDVDQRNPEFLVLGATLVNLRDFSAVIVLKQTRTNIVKSSRAIYMEIIIKGGYLIAAAEISLAVV